MSMKELKLVNDQLKDQSLASRKRKSLERKQARLIGELEGKDSSHTDPKGFVGDEPMLKGGTVIVAFDIGTVVTGPAPSHCEGYKTTGGAIYRGTSTNDQGDLIPYGTFKLTMICEDGKTFQRIKYGPEMDELFGEPIGGLFVKITDDFKCDEFASQVMKLRDTYDKKKVVQMWAEISIQPNASCVLYGEHLGKTQYTFKATLVKLDMLVPGGDTEMLDCSDSPVFYDTNDILRGYPKVSGAAVAITPKNIKDMARAARGKNITTVSNPQEDSVKRQRELAQQLSKQFYKPDPEEVQTTITGGMEILTRKAQPKTDLDDQLEEDQD